MTTQAIQRPTPTNVTRQEPAQPREVYHPNVDIVESPTELMVFADIPGSTIEGIDVRFEAGTLTVQSKVEPRRFENERFLIREYGVGDFRRAFTVSEAIDASKIKAEYSNGVLVLHLPKVEAVKPRKVTVQSGI